MCCNPSDQTQCMFNDLCEDGSCHSVWSFVYLVLLTGSLMKWSTVFSVVRLSLFIFIEKTSHVVCNVLMVVLTVL